MNKQPEKSNQSDTDPPQVEKKPLKLILRRETLRTLMPDDLAQVVGGYDYGATSHREN